MALLADLTQAGKIRSLLGKVFSLEETAQDHEFLDSGLALGQVVISVR